MDKFNCILYGESGVGKTPFAGTLQMWEKTKPCLLLDVDMGAMSLGSLEEKPVVLPVETWPEMAQVYDYFKRAAWDELAGYISKKMGIEVPVLEYRSVVIDSGTELEYKLRIGVVKANEKGDGEVPSQPDYLRTQERFRRMYRLFRDLPISLVMTAGLRELKEESTGIIKRSPGFQPSLSHDLVRMTDLVVYMAVTMSGVGSDAKWTRHLVTSLSNRFIARDRSGQLKPVLEGEKFYWKKILENVLV